MSLGLARQGGCSCERGRPGRASGGAEAGGHGGRRGPRPPWPRPLARPRRKGRRSKAGGFGRLRAAPGRQCLPANNGTIEICRTPWKIFSGGRACQLLVLRPRGAHRGRRRQGRGHHCARCGSIPPRLPAGSLLKGLSLALSSPLGNSLCCLLERKTQSCSRWATCTFLQVPMARFRARFRARVCL